MKRIVGLATVLCLLANLCACGKAVSEEITTAAATTENVKITEEPSTLDPDRSRAIMEPSQGGPMLYQYYGSNRAIGLINQDAEIIEKPQFEDTCYIYNDTGRVIGLIAREEDTHKYIHYNLQGYRRALSCAGYRLYSTNILLEGCYFIVYTSTNGGWDPTPTKPGLFDIENDVWVIEPKENQKISAYKDRVLVSSSDGIDAETYEYYLQDGHTRKLPNGSDYLEEVGWYRSGDWGEWQYFDENFKHIPQLDGCLINPGIGGGDNYILVYTYWNGLDTAVVDRNGNFVKTSYSSIKTNGHCWIGKDGADENSPEVLLDCNLKLIYKLNEGEKLVPIRPLYGSINVFLVQDTKGNVIKAFNENGKPFQTNESLQHFRGAYDDNVFYTLKNGKWSELAEIPFADRPEDESISVYPIVTTDRYLVIWVGMDGEITHDTKKLYAIDWSGNPVDDCPLEPFFTNLENDFESAGKQGRNYYWVGLGNKRGYVNQEGNWLFVDTTNK